MARKATVNREVVLQMLQEGKSSQSIADQFGVSRQAIDLYRKQFTRDGLLPAIRGVASPAVTAPGQTATTPSPPPPSPPTSAAGSMLTLDQMVELIINAFSAMKRIPELEAEMTQCRHQYEEALKEIEELKLREQKRREQEARWIHAQQPGVITGP